MSTAHHTCYWCSHCKTSVHESEVVSYGHSALPRHRLCGGEAHPCTDIDGVAVAGGCFLLAGVALVVAVLWRVCL